MEAEVTQYSQPPAGQGRAEVGGNKICAYCGRRVSSDDRFCPSCGVAFGGPPDRVDRLHTLPGFQYHLVQGLGWGLGFILAAAVVSLVLSVLAYLLVAMALHGVR